MGNSFSPGIKIGVIADTHGLLRPEIAEHLKGSQTILHAGDIGNLEVLEKLKSLAPVFAVRGNVDKGPWAKNLPIRDVVEIEDRLFYLVHSLDDLDLDPAGGFHAVIYGHSHIPKRFYKEGVLYFNPGSAGPKRFKLPVTVGRITIFDGVVKGEIVTL
ncbi:MAG: metallophosphatase family protein [Deltaproteobacteria bacterium]|nr:metallophosphatase family protein [Deltaproteobacteria bacterium]